ncbi:hypothetical protein GW915_13140 [bacterium]|nr:hypothetical protein [bacterium]
MKKQIQFLAVTVLAFGLSACGGNDDVPVQTTYQVPPAPTSGAFSDVTRRAVEQLQHTYGNIQTLQSTVLGNQTLPQGTHSWQTVYDRLAQAARDCAYCQYSGWGGYSHQGGLSNIDMNKFKNYLNMSIIDNTDVRYERDPSFTYSMAHTVDTLLSVMSQSFGYMSNYWGYSSYPVYSYSPYYYGYPQNSLSVGVGFSNGNLSIGAGGNWNF